MKIVIDMLGGDNGLKASIPAVKNFLKKNLSDEVELFLIGDENILSKEFTSNNSLHIVHTTKVVPMDVDPLTAIHDNETSLMVGIKTYLENNCDAIISAGSTGALLTAATLKIKRIKGISRPALISSLPTVINGKKFVCLDLGANASNTKEELNCFATMGSIYYKAMYKEDNPRVYLLNIGTEEEKGNTLTKETFALLKENTHINFKGNIESRDVMNGEADVIVTDGFTGNMFLKTIEGTAKSMSNLIKKAFKRNLLSKIGYLFSKKGINEMRETMNYKNVGGAMLVGVNGVVIKAHGSSDEIAFLSAINCAYSFVKDEIVNKIKEELASGN